MHVVGFHQALFLGAVRTSSPALCAFASHYGGKEPVSLVWQVALVRMTGWMFCYYRNKVNTEIKEFKEILRDSQQ